MLTATSRSRLSSDGAEAYASRYVLGCQAHVNVSAFTRSSCTLKYENQILERKLKTFCNVIMENLSATRCNFNK